MGNARDGRFQRGGVQHGQRYKGGLLEARRFARSGEGMRGRAMDKMEGGTVAPSVVVGDLEAVLRGIKRRISLRLLCFFVGGVCLCLARHGLTRRWPYEASSSEAWSCEAWSCEAWSLPRRWPHEAWSCETWRRRSLVAWVGVGEVVEWEWRSSRC